MRYRYKKNDGGDPAPVNMQAACYKARPSSRSWQHNDIGTSYTLAEQSLTSGQFSAISDLTNLFLQFQTTWWLTDASIDLDFRDALYYDSSDPTVVVTDFLSCSRASIGYAKNADGTLTSFGNDTLRIGVGTDFWWKMRGRIIAVAIVQIQRISCGSTDNTA